MNKSMKLDYIDESAAPTASNPEMTDLIVPSPLEAAVATNITTPVTPEARTSGSNDMTNVVSKCWANIMSSKEVSFLQMEE
ncbi:hypothetical protein C0989_009157 [Termitomyces sp. Mn162]|nr:hypothetical protein C0989_009157 [Termitomyces sp. Mn162]